MKVNVGQVAQNNPDQIVDVRTSSVYSQIARTGRCPSKTKETAILVDALNSVRKSKTVNGVVVTIEPDYVPMKAKDVLVCFGNRVDRLRKNSQVKVIEVGTVQVEERKT